MTAAGRIPSQSRGPNHATRGGIHYTLARMDTWTAQQVIALAPDAASASAGQGLSSGSKWQGTGRSGRAIWGLCKGSGKNPYQTRVDVGEPAFKCSCPSRKFPCKHGLGLLLLFANQPDTFPTADEPGWVSEWLDGRQERTAKKAERAGQQAVEPADPEAQAKRAEKRAQNIEEGIRHCRLWLDDLARRGLAAALADARTDWETTAARMVDAQATGLANMVRAVPGLMASGPGWERRTTDWLGRLYLLLTAGERLDQLPPELADTVRTTLGWTTPTKQVLGQEGVTDRWAVLGQAFDDDGRVRARRTWLFGRASARRALLLDFAPGTRPFEISVMPGTEFDAELCFYPGSLPLRAVIKDRSDALPLDTSLAKAFDATIPNALAGYAAALATDPWLRQWPVDLADARPAHRGDRWFIVDRNDHTLPIDPGFAGARRFWDWLSVTGAEPAGLVLEWDGESAIPIAVRTLSGLAELSAVLA